MEGNVYMQAQWRDCESSAIEDACNFHVVYWYNFPKYDPDVSNSESNASNSESLFVSFYRVLQSKVGFILYCKVALYRPRPGKMTFTGQCQKSHKHTAAHDYKQKKFKKNITINTMGDAFSCSAMLAAIFPLLHNKSRLSLIPAITPSYPCCPMWLTH